MQSSPPHLDPAYTATLAAAPPQPTTLKDVAGYTRILPAILSPTECTALIEHAERNGFVKASLYTDHKGAEHYSDVRKSKRTMIDSREFVDELWKRIAHVVPLTWDGAPLHIAEGATSPLNERLRILKYDTPGDEFRPHADGNYTSSLGGVDSISRITILIYLNVGYTGAFTHFLADDDMKKSKKSKKSMKQSVWIPVIPTVGGVTLQDQSLVHCVPPLISGTKYVVRTEVMYRDN